MPNLPPRPCSQPGCRKFQVKRGRCEDHQQVGGWVGSRGRGGSWTRRRGRVLERDGWLCQRCARVGRLRQADQVDHIVPRAEGGSDEYSNLEAICSACHTVKTQQEARRARAGKGTA